MRESTGKRSRSDSEKYPVPISGIGIVFHEGLIGAEGASLLGDALILVAAVGVGAYTVLSMRVLERHSPLAVATYPTLFGAPVVLLLASPDLPELGRRGGWSVGGGGLLGGLRDGLRLRRLAGWYKPHRGQQGARLPVPHNPHRGRLGGYLLR